MPTPLLTTVRRTAALLGPGWRAAPHDEVWRNAVLLTGPRSGADAFRIRITQEGNRLLAYGYLDREGDRRLLHSADAPQITVSADLPTRQVPRHLAAHLKRRFLSAYGEALDAVAADRARYAQETADRDAVAQLLTDVLPHSHIGRAYNSDHRREVTATNYRSSSLRVAAEVAHDGSHVDMMLGYLSPAQAEAVARLLAADL
ncbi:hypothetical protein GCM10010329_82630 [Streptomyces spiroverticillatus]|uniref:Uncharacterized protein n=1 Tax=Streptomyces finlayi TaxID=67296 RepID=A0A919CFT8_9ACTN|nr:hypothetical protein [Streptomyces finlayi]GHA47707.1 hypothetical protein GCM10010329_82630 [Streptomyces spiroverticillatus]GHD18673.1 hypothetical protein GCM10010334_81700 [Streptomyces finlayi]